MDNAFRFHVRRVFERVVHQSAFLLRFLSVFRAYDCALRFRVLRSGDVLSNLRVVNSNSESRCSSKAFALQPHAFASPHTIRQHILRAKSLRHRCLIGFTSKSASFAPPHGARHLMGSSVSGSGTVSIPCTIPVECENIETSTQRTRTNHENQQNQQKTAETAEGTNKERNVSKSETCLRPERQTNEDR